ncbi:sigma-54 dependent transcriptional regulator [Fusobacterium necrophorum]|nr:sigma-54 dependent transcriptional regulator [Fusobacterium necrophorum]
MFSLILLEKGYSVFLASCIQESKEIIRKHKIDVVVTDLIMKNETGIELLEWIKSKGIYEDIGVIVVTAYGTVETAVKSIQKGAYNYFIKSNDPSTLLLDIERFLEWKNLKNENNFLKNQIKEISMLESKNIKMKEILEICKKIARSKISVLILGESGVGKEVIARYIHEKSERKAFPFIPVNCQEYSEGLLESELFGHEKGAFTGAIRQKIGKFEEATHGTLFLDEMADISLNTQGKLLRILEEKRIERVGGSQKIDIDIRLISATNKNICDFVKNGTVREDFLYRINGIVITIPPLRDRPEDIESFIYFFIKKFEVELKKKIDFIDEETLNFLRKYHYPGNIRELKNIIERLMVLTEGSSIQFRDAKMYLQNADETVNHLKKLKEARNQFEVNFIKSVIIECKGDLTKAAKILDITKRQLNNKILDYNLREWISSLCE